MESKIAKQFEARGINNVRIINAIKSVPRELFMPVNLEPYAYEDLTLKVEENIYIPRLYVVARWLQFLDIQKDDKVLLVAFDSGYLLSVLSQLAKEVFAIDEQEQYINFINEIFTQLNIKNCHLKTGKLEAGWSENAPYDKIFIAAEMSSIPETIINQLKEGGKAFLPIGPDWSHIYLETIEKKAKGYTEKKYITDDYFVPKAQYLPKISEIALPETEIIQQISQTAIAFDSIANFAEESFLERVGEAKVVLFGEASHGTSEFYLMRQQLTKALIEKKGFNIVSTEADWPDMELVNNYVQGSPEEKPGTIPFKRFPHWMWRNLEFMDFMEWLKKYNATHSRKAAIYGLDLYGLENSLNHVVRFLENKDSEITALAKKHYSCISPFLQEPAEYGKMVLTRQIESCEAEVLQMLLKLLKERERLNHSPAYFYACQNARLIVDAERYYRIMYYGGADSWNLRDLHMFYTLKSLLTFHGSDSKAVVWAHNSHIGNALATQMYARGEINIGHLCRETFGERSYHVGFGTHTGTVAAADEWGGAMKIKQVNPSLPASYENLSHQTGIKNFSLPLRHSPEVLKQSLSHPKLERAIGVIYRPDTERISHYFHASLSNQFDEYIWFDTTQAVNALAEAKEPLELSMLHPFAAID